MIVVPHTFQCQELLFVLGRMLPPPELSEAGSVRQAAAQLANTLKRNVIVVDEQELLVVVDDPVEAVVVARDLELRIERCIAAPLALELLHESGEPARQAWAWLESQLGPGDSTRGIVKLTKLGRRALPDHVDRIPDGAGVLLWIVGDTDTVIFVDREQTLGRAAAIVIADVKASRVHAAIVPYRGTWMIEDRGSTSGTFVDDRRCNSRCLVPGMTIRIGDTRGIVLSVR